MNYHRCYQAVSCRLNLGFCELEIIPRYESHSITKHPLIVIGLVNEYPTMHYFGIHGHTQSMIAYEILIE